MHHPIIASFIAADFFGKAIFLALFLLSWMIWSVGIEQWRLLRAVENFLQMVKEALSIRGVAPSLDAYRGDHSAVDALIALFEKGGNGRQSTQALFVILEERCNLFYSGQMWFVLGVTLAPFLGLLGTVWGMLTTFSTLSDTASPSMLWGLSLALATTVVGLIVATPAVIFQTWLRYRADQASDDSRLCLTLWLEICGRVK